MILGFKKDGFLARGVKGDQLVRARREALNRTEQPADDDAVATPHVTRDEEAIIAEINSLATAQVMQFFHKETRTHIAYCADVGPFGVRGTGITAEEAMINFISALDVVVPSAKDFQRDSWLADLRAEAAKQSSDRIVQDIKATKLSGQIAADLIDGLCTALAGDDSEQSGLKQALDIASREIYHMRAKRSVDDVRTILNNAHQEAQKAFRGQSPKRVTLKKVPEEVQARLLFLSAELGIPTVKELSEQVISIAFVERSRVLAKPSL